MTAPADTSPVAACRSLTYLFPAIDISFSLLSAAQHRRLEELIAQLPSKLPGWQS